MQRKVQLRQNNKNLVNYPKWEGETVLSNQVKTMQCVIQAQQLSITI